MARSARLRLVDLRAIYRLVGECRELGDSPILWRTHLLAGTAHLTGAGVAVEYEVRLGPNRDAVSDHPGPFDVVDWGWDRGFDRSGWDAAHAEFAAQGRSYQPMFIPYMEALARGCGPALTRADLVSDRAWYGSPYFRDHHSSMGIDAFMFCYAPVTRGGIQNAIFVIRAAREPDFTQRARAVVQEIQSQIVPLIQGPLSGFQEPSPEGLSRRLQEVLRCLLEGDGDKQIAARLDLSRHTVNSYIKAIFIHFGVVSRSELMARWIRRKWGSGHHWSIAD